MIWDAVAKEKTTHDGLYLAMTQNENDFNDKLSDVYNDFNFVDGFVDVLNDFQVYFNKQTKQYGFIISENFDVQKIQSNDYFALQNILLFESVVYNGISEKTNFVYATTKYILKNFHFPYYLYGIIIMTKKIYLIFYG